MRVKRSLGAALSRRERALGIGPQASGGHEIVSDGVPECVGLRFDETANWKKTEAVVLAVCVDPLDALAQSIDSLARFARMRSRHALRQTSSFSRLRIRRASVAGLTSSRSPGGGE